MRLVLSPPRVFPVLHRDDDFLVIDKPSGWLTHAQRGVRAPDCTAALREMTGGQVHPVHRLDRGASGVLVFALNPHAARQFQSDRENGLVTRHYLALVRGTPPDEGFIDSEVPNDEDGPRVPAQTVFRRLETVGRYSVVACRPITGRFHQIRRHCKHISHPLIGDTNYGKGEHNRLWREQFSLHRLALHAWTVDYRGYRWCAPLAAELVSACAKAGFTGAYLVAADFSGAQAWFTSVPR